MTDIPSAHAPHLGRFVGLIVLVAALLGASQPATATTYIFATFKGDDAAGMKLCIYTSTDSTNFTLLSETGFGGNTTYLRDPSIMKYTDGKYYLAYTDPMKASCCNPEDHFGIAVSSDLMRWTDLTTVKAGVPSVSRTWAPEWYIEAGVVRVIANIDTGNADFEPYAFTAQNSALTSWSGPTALGIGADYIDTYVAKLGSTYHAFIKSEATRYLEHATAQSLTGPWTFVGKDNWAGWGSGLEGPSIVRLDDGRYRMYVDPQSGGTPYQTMTSSDLNTWSAKASIPGTVGPILRHGTVIRDELAPGLTAAGGSSGTGGGAGTGGATGSGGSTGIGGSTNSGGIPGSGGSPATGGIKGTGAAISTSGSTGTAGADGGLVGGAGGSAPGTGGRSGSDMGGTVGSSGGNADAGVATGGVIGLGGAVGAGGAAAKPDAAVATGGTLATGGSGTIGFGGAGGAGTAANASATGGAAGAASEPDAGVREATNPSGCSCVLGGGAASTTRLASPWTWLALASLVLTVRRRKQRRRHHARENNVKIKVAVGGRRVAPTANRFG